MSASSNAVVSRQEAISNGEFERLEIPKLSKYAICNLRGGIGKTTIAFNLTYYADNILAVDTCPQGNLSYHFDNEYYTKKMVTVKDMIFPYIIPGYALPDHVATYIGATNSFFEGKNAFQIPSSPDLYMLPSQLVSALNLSQSLQPDERRANEERIIQCLKTEIDKSMAESELNKCIIDTSPFFAGATQLAWNAVDALIIPVRTDQQSVSALEMIINTIKSSSSEYRKYLPGGSDTVKIQMVILTHCGWSTVPGSRNVPNSQTMIYLTKISEILSQNRTLLTTNNPENHICLLDDFLGSGRISSALSKPLELLRPGESRTIDRQRVSVNDSVTKCKNQLKYIYECIW